MNVNTIENFSILSDYYEFTMGNGFLDNGYADTIAYFDLYYRNIPDDGGFAIAAGLEPLIEYIQNLHFGEEEISFLREKGIFSEEFLGLLKNFKFSCDVWAVPEGTVVFPNEPLVIVRGPIIEAAIIETMALLIINHQSLIATKANRIVRAAEGRTVMEFGARRAHGVSAATLGARSAYIGGAHGTSNTLTDMKYGVPSLGTMAHSWVQLFPTEYDAFAAYANTYPDNCILLVDTYDTLRSGVPNAIKVFDDIVTKRGFRPKGIRLDSGDIAYLSKQARKMLDDAGYSDCQISASNSLDEFTIREMIAQGAQVDSFGVGERLITAKSNPVFGGVYKLVAIERDGVFTPKIKISSNVEKITTPGFKNVFRIYDKQTGKANADLITTFDEKITESEPLEIFHPTYTWKRKTFHDFTVRSLLVPIFEKGNLVYDIPTIEESRKLCEKEVDSLWEEVKRFDNPHEYIVDLSLTLWQMKEDLLQRS